MFNLALSFAATHKTIKKYTFTGQYPGNNSLCTNFEWILIDGNLTLFCIGYDKSVKQIHYNLNLSNYSLYKI